jgi:metal-dependent amidase/aminoacylase/carboxypeptidase family protein
MLQKLVTLRREIHRFPELSGKEFETAQRIVNFLTPFDPSKIITDLGTTGVAAVYDFGEVETTIMIRCELDALPIQEVNSFEYRSVNDSVVLFYYFTQLKKREKERPELWLILNSKI